MDGSNTHSFAQTASRSDASLQYAVRIRLGANATAMHCSSSSSDRVLIQQMQYESINPQICVVVVVIVVVVVVAVVLVVVVVVIILVGS